MSALKSISDFAFIPLPRCPNCKSRTTLDLRTFECGKCAHVEKVVVEVDPMKTRVLGWLWGELRPPS